MAGLIREVLGAIEEVPREAWDALAGGGKEPVPFLRWDWIHALEASGSASRKTGWEPSHIVLRKGRELVAAMPAWRKHHSMGEYVYDFAWAEAAAQLGVAYYPKLLVGVPLAPITAPRLLVAPGEDVAVLRARLVEAAREVAEERDCSSVHVIFPPEEEAVALQSLGMAHRLGAQFHWKNRGYQDYGEFLARFSAKRRHQLRRERAEAAKQGIEIATVRGEAVGEEEAELAWRLYQKTAGRYGWGRVQLNRGFFQGIFQALPERLEVVEARRDGKVIAGAFNVAFGERLFGRYWGAFEEVPFLHFHVCLYHSIDECIRLGRQVFEPGAGGEHKISRGFEPTAVHSVHLLFDARLDRAVRNFLGRERVAVGEWVEEGEAAAGLRPISDRGS